MINTGWLIEDGLQDERPTARTLARSDFASARVWLETFADTADGLSDRSRDDIRALAERLFPSP